MYPRLIISDSMAISMYSVFYILGMLLAAVIAVLEVRRKQTIYRNIPNLTNFAMAAAFWAIFFGIIGGKILYILLNHRHDFWDRPIELLTSGGGSVYYGTEILGALGLIAYLTVRRYPVLHTLDIGGIALPAAHGLGRIGCFLSGCCGGTPAHSPLGICFPHHPNTPVHPTQLYETVTLLIFAAVIWIYRKRIPVPGRIYSLYLMTYGLIRFFIEFYRETAHPGGWLQISPNQYIALAQFVTGVVLLIWTAKFYKTKSKPE